MPECAYRLRSSWPVALGATAAILIPGAAASQDGSELAPARGDREVRTVLFGSMDAGSSNFLTVGAKYAPDSVDRDGALFLASTGYGMRFERDGVAPSPPEGVRRPLVARHTAVGAVLGGYQWSFPWGVAALYTGPEFSYEVVDSAFAPRIGPRLGWRVQGEVWANPTSDTLLTGTVILGSARESAWTRVAWGYRLLDVFVGPEASLYADTTRYRKWGLGLHATGLSLGDVSFRLSAGWLLEEQVGSNRNGGYVALTAWTRL